MKTKLFALGVLSLLFALSTFGADSTAITLTSVKDVVVYEDANPLNLGNLKDIFTSQSALSFSVENSNPSLVTVEKNSEDRLLLRVRANRNGGATIVLRATNVANQRADTFVVTVLPVDDFFALTDTIANIILSGSEVRPLRLDSIFSSDSTPLYTAWSLDSSLVRASIDVDGMMSFERVGDADGETNVWVSAQYDGVVLIDTFMVAVRADWKPIYRTQTIDELSVAEDHSPNDTFPIQGNFRADNANKHVHYELNKLRGNYTLNAFLDSTDKDSVLLIYEYKQDSSGHSDFVLVAFDDSGYTARDTFGITVRAANDAPYVETPYDDIVRDERDTTWEEATDKPIMRPYGGSIGSGHFDDVDIDDSHTFYVASTDSTLVIPSIKGGKGDEKVFLTFRGSQFGQCKITVRVKDRWGDDNTDTFMVTINEVVAPELDTIPDIRVYEDALDYLVDLHVYSAVSGGLDFSKTTYSATVVDIPTLISTSIDQSIGMLTLHFEKDQNGFTNIAVSATDGDTTLVDTFLVEVVPVWDPIVLKMPIPDATKQEDTPEFEYITSVASYFTTDSDGSGEATYNAVAHDSSLTPHTYQNYITRPTNKEADTLVGAKLTIEFEPDAFGNTYYYWSATDDSGFQAFDTSIVYVQPVIDTPTIVGAIADTTVDEDSDTLPTDFIFIATLDTVFSTTEYYASLEYRAESADSALLVPVLQNGKVLGIDLRPDANGSAKIYVTCTDRYSGASVIDTFMVTVNPIADITDITDTIANVAVYEDADPTLIDLDSITDSDLSLTYSATTLDSTLLLPTVDGSGILTLTYEPNANGQTEVMVTVEDSDGKEVFDTFTVTVYPVNDTPVVAIVVHDTTVLEDAAPLIYSDIFAHFSDDEAITAVTVETAQRGLITPTITGGNLTITLGSHAFGQAIVTLKAFDGEGLFVTTSFVVTITEVVEPPVVIAHLPDTTVFEDADPISMGDLDLFFSDDDSALTYSVIVVDPRLVIPVVTSNNELLLKLRHNANGVTDIIVRANDGTTSVSDTFELTIIPVDDPSEITDTIADVFTYEDAAPFVIDLDSIIKLDIAMTYSASSNNSPVVATSIDNTLGYLTLTYAPDSSGSATVSVTATDTKGETVFDTFEVLVAPVWDEPTHKTALLGYTVKEDDKPLPITITDVFNSIESDFNYRVTSFDTALVAATLVGDSVMELTFKADAYGEVDVELEGKDGASNLIYDTSHITIEEVNDAPILTRPFDDIVTPEDSPSRMLVLSNHFEDDKYVTLYTTTTTDSLLLKVNVVSGKNLELEYRHNANGEADVIVTAFDAEGLFATDTFHVTVTPVDDLTDLDTTIADIYVPENSLPDTLDLGKVVELSPSVTFTATSFNTALVSTAIDPLGYVELTYAPDTIGVTHVEVTADDGIDLIKDTFMVLIYPVWHAPEVIDTLADITMAEDDPDSIINLEPHFKGEELLSFSAISADNLLATVATNGQNLVIHPQFNAFGITTIAVQGTDSKGFSVSDTFSLTITEVIEPPVISLYYEDMTVPEDTLPLNLGDMNNHFSDIDDSVLTYTVTVSDSLLLTPVVTATNLTLNLRANANGRSEVIVACSDGVSSVSDTFMVTVTPVADIFDITDTIEDIVVDEDAPDTILDLAAIAGADVPLFYTARTFDPTLISVATDIHGFLTISFLPDANGETDVYVEVTDGDTVLTDIFHVTVNPIDDAPEVAQGLEPIVVLEDATPLALGITHVFSGESDLSIDAESSDKDLFKVKEYRDSAVVLTFKENAFGKGYLILTAEDEKGESVTCSTIVLVHPINDAPVITSEDLGKFDSWNTVLTSLEATDIDDTVLQWLIFAQPQGVELDDKSGDITWEPEGAHMGYHSFIAMVIDEQGASDTAFQFIRITKEGSAAKEVSSTVRVGRGFTTPVVAYPSVLTSQSEVMIFKLADPSVKRVEITIFDPLGNRVYENSRNVTPKDIDLFSWDGTNHGGSMVSGAFSAVVKVITQKGETYVTHQIVGVKND